MSLEILDQLSMLIRSYEAALIREGGLDSWKDEDGIQRRFVEDLDVFEVSIIDNTKSPAYVGTSIEMRDDKEIISENRNSESEIRVVDSSTKSEKREEVDYSKYEEEIKKLEK